MRKRWVRAPHSGGLKIPEDVKARTRSRILAYARENYAGKYIRIDVRFRGPLCYIDAYREPSLLGNFDPTLHGESHEECLERLRNTPIHLCRLRYFGSANRWAMAFYKYSNEKYEPSVFMNGSFLGTPEEAFETSALYLMD